jgi:uncharacterized membrane protein
MMKLARFFRHLLTPPWLPLRGFSTALRAEIAAAVAASETRHRGEIRIAVEGPLPWRALWRDQTPRARAIELFAKLRTWDTEENSGVLIYLQLVDRDVEILADRGIAAKVPQAEWEALCRALEAAMRVGRCREGVLAAIDSVTRLLEQHFPAGSANPNELPNEPFVI